MRLSTNLPVSRGLHARIPALRVGHPVFQVLTYRTPRGLRNQGDQDWVGSNDVNFGWHSDLVMGTVHSGTHIDALSHITCGGDNHFHGGVSSDTALGDFGPLVHDATEIPSNRARLNLKGSGPFR